MRKKLLTLVFLIIGLVGMLGFAKAAPISYYWRAHINAHSQITIYDDSKKYAIYKSIYDYANINSSWYHNPPAQTSLSESYSYNYYGETREWSGESNVISDPNGINVYGRASTNPFVNADDYTSSHTYGQQYGYFYIDSPDKFLKVDFIFNINGNDGTENDNYAWIEFDWYLRDCGIGDENDDKPPDYWLAPFIARTYIYWNVRNINTPSSHEDHWLIPLEEGHWYYLYANADEILRAYQNDWLEGSIQLSTQITAVPIPASAILLLSGMFGVIGIGRKLL